jgi:hypothetical protein
MLDAKVGGVDPSAAPLPPMGRRDVLKAVLSVPSPEWAIEGVRHVESSTSGSPLAPRTE